MSVFDVRVSDNENKIKEIVFAGVGGTCNNAVMLTRDGHHIGITDEEDETVCYIDTREDAQNMITALKKAIDLGWWENK